jgi:lethal(2) giant larvae protein
MPTAILGFTPLHVNCRHESGEVKFWDVTTGAMKLISQVKTANLFVGQESPVEVMEDFSDFKWPPYYKVSTYDPFEDDPRLAIKCLEFCPLSRTLCVGGNGGQVITFSFSPMPTEISLKVTKHASQ